MIQVPTRLMAPLFFLLFSSAQAGQIVEQTFTADTSDNPVRPWQELEREGRVLGVDLSHWTHSLVTDPDKAKRRCEVAQADYFATGSPREDWRLMCTSVETTGASYVWAKNELTQDDLVRKFVEYNVFQRWDVSTPRPTPEFRKIREENGIAYYHGKGGKYTESLAVFQIPSPRYAVQVYVIVVVHGDPPAPEYAARLLSSHAKLLQRFTRPVQ